MILNDAGEMVKKWYFELENKFPDIKCDRMIIMPNHFHAIINNVGISTSMDSIVGADLCVCPNNRNPSISGEQRVSGEHIGSPLRRVVQWFKTMTTNEYIRGVKNKNWQRFDQKMWQRNYWEHIIQNNDELGRISQYIMDNPKKWNNDKLNGGNGNVIMESQTVYGYENWMV